MQTFRSLAVAAMLAGSFGLFACGSSVDLSSDEVDSGVASNSTAADDAADTFVADSAPTSDTQPGATDSRVTETRADDSGPRETSIEDSSSEDTAIVDSGSALDTSPCPPGLIVCGSTCSDLSTDPYNCGACDHACATGAACAGGACSACPADKPTLCVAPTEYCADTQSDPSNCGTCGHACALGFACSKGACSELKTRPCDLSTVKVESSTSCDPAECTSSAPAETGFGASGDYHEWSFGGRCLVCSCRLL
jgi:hypothetical protein